MAKNAIHLANLARMYRKEYEEMLERAASLEASVMARIEYNRINPRIANPRLTDVSTPGGVQRLAAQSDEMEEDKRRLREDCRRLARMCDALERRVVAYRMVTSPEFVRTVMDELYEEVRRRASEDFGNTFMNNVSIAEIEAWPIDPSSTKPVVSKIRRMAGIAE